MSNMAPLFHEHAEVCSVIKSLTAQKARIEAEVATAFKSDFDSQLEGKDYGCGSAKTEQDGWTVKATIAKDIDYDQAKLRDLYFNVLPKWGNPDEYVKVTFDVEERKYNAWPTPIRELFEPARTVKPGKMKISIEKNEEREAA